MIVALIVLNLAGDGLEDLERLEQDTGFVQVMREVEHRLLLHADRRPPGAANALTQTSATRRRPRQWRTGWPGSTPLPTRAGFEWKSLIGCSRHEDIKCLASVSRPATLFADPLGPLHGLA